MINTNDAAKALRIIADDLEKYDQQIINEWSVSVGLDVGVLVDVSVNHDGYDLKLQFSPEILKRAK